MVITCIVNKNTHIYQPLETVLSISSLGFPIFSARGCEQILEPISQDHQFFRNIDGDLIFNGHSCKKYKTRIQCKDHYPPATDRLTIGDIVEVSCLSTLCQTYINIKQSLEIELQKKAVIDSIDVSCDHQNIPFELKGTTIFLPSVSGNVLVSYRPILTMRFLGYSFSTHEWDMTTEWSMTFEEM